MQVISARALQPSRRRTIHPHRLGDEERAASGLAVRCWAGHRGMPNGQQIAPGMAASDRCMAREGPARARMLSPIGCADVSGASESSSCLRWANWIFVEIIPDTVPTAVSGDFGRSVDRIIG